MKYLYASKFKSIIFYSFQYEELIDVQLDINSDIYSFKK